MECFNKYSDCIDVRTGNQKCKYYEDSYQYCYFSIENVAWWWWLILAVIIIMFISFITCCVCCCQKKKVKYQKIVEIKVPSQEQQSFQVPAQNVQAYQQYQQYQNVQNVQPVMPQMYIPQPVYQQIPTVPNYGYGVQQQRIQYPRDPMQIIQ
ncbi:Hypothetical_protein [Hexamita inflata]|uniref:Hypothetical_protein n=1 Tax=Hexamita inflata TaxID=28002 RepID=A0AA86UBK4_9EUKA|nr:Hypothetical protein HINF_LOCUS36824 [Hexamita inflata]